MRFFFFLLFMHQRLILPFEQPSSSHLCSLLCFFLDQTAESSDEEMLHIDTESKPEVKASSLKVKKKDHSAAGILDLLQASKQVGGIDYGTNR